MRVDAVILPSARRPVPATSLYVEPGGYWSLIAWLTSGLSGSFRSFLVRRPGLMPAAEHVVVVARQARPCARISPFCGFITITTPRFSPACLHAPAHAPSRRRFCAWTSIVRRSELPATGRLIGVEGPGWRRPAASRSTVCRPYSPRKHGLVRRLDARAPQQVVRAGSPSCFSSASSSPLIGPV